MIIRQIRSTDSIFLHPFRSENPLGAYIYLGSIPISLYPTAGAASSEAIFQVSQGSEDMAEAPLGASPNAPLGASKLPVRIRGRSLVPVSTIHTSIIPSDADFQDVLPESDPMASRFQRYVRQSAARRLLSGERVALCMRSVHNHGDALKDIIKGQKFGLKVDPVKIMKSKTTGSCFYTGTSVCGCVWPCPVCSHKISQRRSEILKLISNAHNASGGSMELFTLTFPHAFADPLDQTMPRLRKVWHSLTSSKKFHSVLLDLDLVGYIRSLEVTHGGNGFHPHFHVVFYFPEWCSFKYLDEWGTEQIGFKRDLCERFKHSLFDLWFYYCKKHGLGEPSYERGINSVMHNKDSKYPFKWGIEDELVKKHSKKGKAKTSRAMYQLLDDYIEGDIQAGELFREFAVSFKGFRQIQASKGLLKVYPMVDYTDEYLATREEDKADILATLSFEDWAKIRRVSGKFYDYRAVLLNLAETGGYDAVRSFISSL